MLLVKSLRYSAECLDSFGCRECVAKAECLCLSVILIFGRLSSLCAQGENKNIKNDNSFQTGCVFSQHAVV